MEGKGSDTEDEFEDLLEDAMGDFPDKPHKDPPPPYKPPANPDPEIALSPAPQGGVISAELLEDSVEIKKLNEKVDGLEEKIRICCPEKPDKEKEKIKPKRDVKYDYKTRGWIAIRGGSAYSGNIGPLSGPRDRPRKPKPHRPGQAYLREYREARKILILGMGLVGYSERNAVRNHEWWPRDQTHDPDEMLKNTIKESHTDQYIAPGVSLHLIKKKIKEGFVIEFEDPLDAQEMEQLMGTVSGYKKKKRKKKKSKKKKSRRSSKKKKKSKRKKSRRRK
jgi:hypothetical protein